MRQKRAKSYRKQMNVYIHAFKFREPYQAIVDHEFIIACEKATYNLNRGLKNTIQGEVKPMITQCCMQALYDNKDQHIIDVAKTFERRRCNHREAINPSKCIDSIVDIKGENKHRYIVATQDKDLRKKFRNIPGIPLIFMDKSVMILEPLSRASAKKYEDMEAGKLTQGLNDYKNAGYINKQENNNNEPEKTSKKRKGPKAPNPLSMKKKKTNPNANPNSDANKSESEGEKKKRRRAHRPKDASKNDESEVTETGASSTSKSEAVTI
ncbi:Fcf1-domain-containing protein [Scheffersomyces amazonensis]|uniref:Fcf1-domain-containing protein n=1 Tax=Scheffersomyces amazonensis TaxID=1078765 RepID=UPI00315C6CA0